MISKSDLTVSIKEVKAFGITLVSILGVLGFGAMTVSSTNKALDTAMIRSESSKDEFKKYFEEMYPVLNQKYIDVETWSEFLEKTEGYMLALDDVKEVDNFAIKHGLVNTEFESRYLNRNIRIQKDMEVYIGDLDALVSKGKVHVTSERKLYEVKSSKYMKLLTDLRAYVKGM